MREQFVTTISATTLPVLFVVGWGTVVKSVGLLVTDGKFKMIDPLLWMMCLVTVVNGAHVRIRGLTTVSTVKMYFFSARELVS